MASSAAAAASSGQDLALEIVKGVPAPSSVHHSDQDAMSDALNKQLSVMPQFELPAGFDPEAAKYLRSALVKASSYTAVAVSKLSLEVSSMARNMNELSNGFGSAIRGIARAFEVMEETAEKRHKETKEQVMLAKEQVQETKAQVQQVDSKVQDLHEKLDTLQQSITNRDSVAAVWDNISHRCMRIMVKFFMNTGFSNKGMCPIFNFFFYPGKKHEASNIMVVADKRAIRLLLHTLSSTKFVPAAERGIQSQLEKCMLTVFSNEPRFDPKLTSLLAGTFPVHTAKSNSAFIFPLSKLIRGIQCELELEAKGDRVIATRSKIFRADGEGTDTEEPSDDAVDAAVKAGDKVLDVDVDLKVDIVVTPKVEVNIKSGVTESDVEKVEKELSKVLIPCEPEELVSMARDKKLKDEDAIIDYLSKRFYFGLPVTKEWQEQDVVIKAINEIRSKAYGLDPIKAGETFTLSADLKEVDYDDEPQAWADMMGEWYGFDPKEAGEVFLAHIKNAIVDQEEADVPKSKKGKRSTKAMKAPKSQIVAASAAAAAEEEEEAAEEVEEEPKAKRGRPAAKKKKATAKPAAKRRKTRSDKKAEEVEEEVEEVAEEADDDGGLIDGDN